MDFSGRILAIRKDMRLSQEKFGERIGMSQRTVAAWESGERMPSLNVLSDLAASLSLSVDYLLGKDEQKENSPPSDGELREEMVRRVQALPEPALARVQDFLDGLEAGLSVGSAAPAAGGPAAGSAE